MNLETFFKCEFFTVAVYMHLSLLSASTSDPQKPILWKALQLAKNLSDKSDGSEDKIFCFRCQETNKVCKDHNSTQILPPLLRIWTSWPRFRFSPFFPHSPVSPCLKDLFCHFFSNERQHPCQNLSFCKPSSTHNIRHRGAEFLLWKLCHGKGAKDQETDDETF